MPVERRDRQNLALDTGTLSVRSNRSEGQEREKWSKTDFPDRWSRISERAQDKEAVFNNLLSHIKVEALKEAFKAIDGNKALGVDRVSKTEYGKRLEENLKDLEKRIQNGSYKPQPKREVLIPKANGKKRPIAIACFEDKLVDWVVGKILTLVYEPLFIRNSFGYRPHKSAHDAIRACYMSLKQNKRQHVVEIDFSSFFNTIPHRKLMRIIGRRISDGKLKGLIGRFLKGGLISKPGEITPSTIGTPQGSIMSPILANIYLNEVLDTWFIKNYASYDNIIVRYADDAVFFFKREYNAEKFMKDLEGRCEMFGLELNKDKTKTFQFTKQNHQHFSFLGFTFYWGRQNSKIMLKVKTQKEKLIKAMQEFDQWIKETRNRSKLDILWKIAAAKIRGHMNYYGFWMNRLKLHHFYGQVIKSMFKWLNRRSQKKSYSWEGFKERLKHFPLMQDLKVLKLMNLGSNPYVTAG